jgi:RimJ/RimL family protein N-acetyltransferase
MLVETPNSVFLKHIKQTAGLPGPQLSLPVGMPIHALLRPVATKRELINSRDVRALTEWRNRFVTAFLNEFVATEEQTADWLINTVGPSDTKILFMLDDLQGNTFGYMGVAYIDWEKSYGEADAIVRGEKAPSGTMTLALKALLTWAQVQLGLQEIGVRVRSDNSALEFYKKFGFIEEKRVSLKCIENPDKTVWIENPELQSSSISLIYMKLGRK